MLRTKLKAMLMAPKKDNRVYLYNQGDTCDSVTGGWTVIGSAKLNDESITISHNTRGLRLTTNKPVDLTDKLLCIQTIETDKYTSQIYYLAFDLSTDAELTINKLYTAASGTQRGELITKKLGVENGSFYVRIVTYWGVWRIDKIWLEDKDAV